MRARFLVPALLSEILIMTAACDPAAAPAGDEPVASGSSTGCVSAGDDRREVCPRGVPPIGDHSRRLRDGGDGPSRSDAGLSRDGASGGDAPSCPGAVELSRDLGQWQCSATGVWSRFENREWLCADGRRTAAAREHRSLIACVP